MSRNLGPFLVMFLYPLVPWTGVMLLGFGVSPVFELPASRRNAILLKAGLAMTTAFLLLRGLDAYGDPRGWHVHPGAPLATALDFLNTTKYPPSLAFLLMTLGPAAVLCAWAHRAPRLIAEVLVMFGRVPFAFYVAHWLLMHTLSVLLGVLQGFRAAQLCTLFVFYPAGYGVSLLGVYVVWVLVIVVLLPWCRWVVGVKARRRDWWLSYL